MNDQSGRPTIQSRGRGARWGRDSGYATGYAWWGSDPSTAAGTRERTPGGLQEPDFRVSDDDRNSVAQDLNEHFEAGRLDMAEHQERITQALGARTRRDLAGLLSDLPPLRPSNNQRLPRGRPAPWIAIPVLLAIILAVTVGNVIFGIRHGFYFPWFLIPIGIVVVRLRRRGWRTGIPIT